MIPIRPRTIGIGGLLLSAWAGLVFLNAFSPPVPAQEKQPPKTETGKQDEKTNGEQSTEKTHTVKAAPFRIETELDGVFEAKQMTPVSLRPDVFQSLEVVKAVSHGAEVKKGQQLVWFETKDLDERIAETELAVELGRLSLKDAREELDYLEATMPLTLAQAERSQEIAQRRLKQYLETDRPLAERSAKQSLKNSKGRLENATEELRQLEKMYKADDLTEETEEIILKRARRSVESAELSLDLAKVQTERSLKESIPEREKQLTEAAEREDLALAKLKATLPIERRRQEIALEKLEREQENLVEKLEKLKNDRKLLEVKAPADGVVYYGRYRDGKWSNIDTIAKQLEPGKTLTPNQVFMTIVQLRPLAVRMSVSEKELRHVRKGVKGQAIPTAFPERKLPVTVNEVDRIPDGSTKFDALANLKLQEDDALVPGMTCKVKLVPYEKKNAIAIPEKALFHEDEESEKAFVYLVGDDGEAVRQSVTTGRMHDGKVEITKGLKAGDEILTEKPEE